MASKWLHADVLDQGPNYIKQNCTRLLLLSQYTLGDSYATVDGNKIAQVTMANADFTLGTSGNDRTLTTASGKSANATAAATGTPDLHFAFVDPTNSKVLWVTHETSNPTSVALGQACNFPSLVLTSQAAA